MTAPGGGVEVNPEALEASAAFQGDQRTRAERTSATVREATAQGNLFGAIGQMAGLDSSYRTWVEDEATALTDLGRMMDDLAEGLRVTASNYVTTDQQGDELIRGNRWETA